jgi:hypothetical protein
VVNNSQTPFWKESIYLLIYLFCCLAFIFVVKSNASKIIIFEVWNKDLINDDLVGVTQPVSLRYI